MKLHKERYLLDTNIVLYSLFDQKELETHILDLLDDYYNKFYISVISVQEIIHLHKQNKIKSTWKSPEDILPAIKATGFEFLFLKEEHLSVYDPQDHLIISQAITEHITLISSDTKFAFYTTQKLNLLFNSRS
jgi:PIN domain nuclease of toxin-antitoxin system